MSLPGAGEAETASFVATAPGDEPRAATCETRRKRTGPTHGKALAVTMYLPNPDVHPMGDEGGEFLDLPPMHDRDLAAEADAPKYPGFL